MIFDSLNSVFAGPVMVAPGFEGGAAPISMGSIPGPPGLGGPIIVVDQLISTPGNTSYIRSNAIEPTPPRNV